MVLHIGWVLNEAFSENVYFRLIFNDHGSCLLFGEVESILVKRGS